MPGPEVGLLSLLQCVPARGAAMQLGSKGDIQALLPSCCSEDVLSPAWPGVDPGGLAAFLGSAHCTPSWDAAVKSPAADAGWACFSLVRGVLGRMVCLSLVLLS